MSGAHEPEAEPAAVPGPEAADEGLAEDPAGEPAAAEDEAPAARPGAGPVVFLDPSAEARDAAEELEDELGFPVWTFDPAEFCAETFDEVADASAIVIEWNLQGQCGIDLLEALLFDDRTRQVPVLLASATPTRAMVLAALRCGARSFTMKPYQAGELRSRLEALGVRPPA